MKNGGQAFPAQWWEDAPQYGKTAIQRHKSVGMSLRDYFAAAALQGLCANSKLYPVLVKRGEDVSFENTISRDAYTAADAMLAERAKGE